MPLALNLPVHGTPPSAECLHTDRLLPPAYFDALHHACIHCDQRPEAARPCGQPLPGLSLLNACVTDSTEEQVIRYVNEHGDEGGHYHRCVSLAYHPQDSTRHVFVLHIHEYLNRWDNTPYFVQYQLTEYWEVPHINAIRRRLCIEETAESQQNWMDACDFDEKYRTRIYTAQIPGVETAELETLPLHDESVNYGDVGNSVEQQRFCLPTWQLGQTTVSQLGNREYKHRAKHQRGGRDLTYEQAMLIHGYTKQWRLDPDPRVYSGKSGIGILPAHPSDLLAMLMALRREKDSYLFPYAATISPALSTKRLITLDTSTLLPLDTFPALGIDLDLFRSKLDLRYIKGVAVRVEYPHAIHEQWKQANEGRLNRARN